MASAYAEDISLTAILSMTDVGGRLTLDILNRRIGSDPVRLAQFNALQFRLRLVEC